MRKVLTTWALGAIPVLFIVSVITFALTALIPGDPGRTILGQAASADSVAKLNTALGVNEPLPVRYWNWLTSAVQGNLGTSLTSGSSVSGLLSDRIGVTISLVVGAAIIAAIVGVGLGVTSAVRGGALGRLVDGSAVLGMSIPVYWLGLILVFIFAVKLRIFPTIGYTPPTESIVDWMRGLVLPWLTLGLATAAPVAKQTRAGVLSQLNREYVRTLRARGYGEPTIIFKNVLFNAAAPILTVLGVVIVGMFGGSVLIEHVFAMPGLGSLAVNSSASQDIPAMQGVAVLLTIFVIIVNGLIEVLYYYVNPKARA